MERLVVDLQHMSDHIAGLIGEPTESQLKAKATALSEAIAKDSCALPFRVNQIIVEAFAETMGWDFKRKAIANKLLFTKSGLDAALALIIAEIQNWSPAITPTPEELTDISVACNKLWDLDVHRLIPERDYVINMQSSKNAFDTGDFCSEPLFTYVDEKVFERPTYKAFVALLDNYCAQVGVAEQVTGEERKENKAFLSLIMDTAVMQYCHAYLLAHKKTAATTRDQFILELYDHWFATYSRRAQNDSSGFEHVFLGEITDKGEVSGLHNWIQLYQEEKAGRLNYYGSIRPKRRALSKASPLHHEQLVTIQFAWNAAVKPVSSSLIGSSPEFEMALYTLCFFMGQTETVVRLGPYAASITCYTWPASPRPGQQVRIATSFPSEVPLADDEVPYPCSD